MTRARAPSIAALALLALAGLPLFALWAGFGGVEPVTVLFVAGVLIAPLFALASATLLASVWCRQTRDAVLALYVLGLAGWLGVWWLGGVLDYLNPLYVLTPMRHAVASEDPMSTASPDT